MNTIDITGPTFEGRTADQWDEEAARCIRQSAASWERSDTDGFMTQWANSRMATKYRRLADLARNGGTITVHTVQEIATGDIAQMEWEESNFYNGARWVRLPSGRYINESRAKKSATRIANYAKKGVRPVLCSVPALLDHRTYDVYPDRDAQWVVDEEATAEWETFLDRLYARQV